MILSVLTSFKMCICSPIMCFERIRCQIDTRADGNI